MTSEHPADDDPSLDANEKADAQPAHATPTERNWWDKWKPIVEISGVVLLAIYTSFTIPMYFANKKAADAAKSAVIITLPIQLLNPVSNNLEASKDLWFGPVQG